MVRVSVEYGGRGLRSYVTWIVEGSQEERVAKAREIYDNLERAKLPKIDSWERDGVYYVGIPNATYSNIYKAVDGLVLDHRGMRRSDLEILARDDLGLNGRLADIELTKRTLQERGGDLLINGPATGI